MLLRLRGGCQTSDFWLEVRRRVEELHDAVPAYARAWTVTVRRKTPLDDRALVSCGEADDPAEYWAVFVDDDARELTVGVPADGDAKLRGVTATAGFVIDLLDHLSHPVPDVN